MDRTAQRQRDVFSRIGVIITVGLLTVGLTGCYTQLQTADPTPSTTARKAPRAQKKPAEQNPTYAREYHREYRTDDSYADSYDGAYGYDGSLAAEYDYLYEYKYQYKYKYGAPHQYRSRYGGWCDDAFFHDPWYYDSWCGPSHGSRFSLSSSWCCCGRHCRTYSAVEAPSSSPSASMAAWTAARWSPTRSTCPNAP